MGKFLVDVLEGVGKEFIEDDKFARIRKKFFQDSHGIYVLYNKKGKPYYIGQTSDLKNRLKQHQHNKHSGKWDTFSIYFTKTKSGSMELESVALSMLWKWEKPEGNKQKPDFKENKMREKILKEMRKMNEHMLGRHSAKPAASSSRPRKSTNRAALKGLVSLPAPLKKEYKRSGKVVHAILLPSGKIECQGKKYFSPSGAARAASGKTSEDGWDFWTIHHHGKWITLDELATSAGSKPPAAIAFKTKGHQQQLWKGGSGKAKAASFRWDVLPLQAKYKGQTYKAGLLSCGKKVQHGGKTHSSPSAAARAVTGQVAANGWTFWLAEASPGNWVTLKSFMKSFANKAS